MTVRVPHWESMVVDLVRVSFECEECGCGVLAVENEPTNDSWVTCKDCGWIFGRFKHLKFEAAQKASPGILTEVRERLEK